MAFSKLMEQLQGTMKVGGGIPRQIWSGMYSANGSSAHRISTVSDSGASLISRSLSSQCHQELLLSRSENQYNIKFHFNQKRLHGTIHLAAELKTNVLSKLNISSRLFSRVVNVRIGNLATRNVTNSAVTSEPSIRDYSLRQLIDEFNRQTNSLLQKMPTASNPCEQIGDGSDVRVQELKAALRIHFKDPNCFQVVPVTWEETSAEAIEIITRNEAVHPVSTISRAKRRFYPSNRRVFALVHKQMPTLPLACVHVALTHKIVRSLQELGELDEHDVKWDPNCLEKDKEALAIMLQSSYEPASNAERTTCAIFYTISNLHPHLPLPPIGKSLVKGAVQHLQVALPQLKTFSTLSPVPGFTQWLKEVFNRHNGTGTQSESLCQILNQSEGQVQISEADLEAMEQVLDSSLSFAKQKSILRSYGQQFDNLLLYYLTKVKKNSKNIDSSSQKPQNCENSVAHFHVSSGASLHHIHCPFTDRSRFESGQSEGGMNSQQSLDHSNDVSSLSENYNFSLNHPLVSKRMWDYSLGYMVNYLYDLSSQTENAKQYKKNGTVPITLCTRK
ncbi:uncharacterized protein LOC142337718 isoform X2 [Convolutriloba macropyga]|uniref:uncharacterized protein LOC142337718 isoform X2 n=1 Tax=Convolutriloba macropyga TaxID=536237 RepID=UPI003F523B18